MKIVISESQYKTIFLLEQSDRLGKGGDFQPLKNQKIVDFEPNFNIQQIKVDDPPLYQELIKQHDHIDMGTDRFAKGGPYDIQIMQPMNEFGKKHDYCCGKDQKKCKYRGQINTCVTKKGSWWDSYYGLRGEYELPIKGGFYDGRE